MATVTKPIVLDETLQATNTALAGIKEVIGQQNSAYLLKTGGALSGDITTHGISPEVSDTYSLGTSEKEYLNGYIKYLTVQYLKLGGKDCDIVGLHNGLYRGACLYDAVNGKAGVFSSIADIYTAVHAGNFDNIYIGDYILVKISGSYTWTASDGATSTVSFSETVKMVVGGIDYYIGRYGLGTHHLVLLPEDCFAHTSPMNNTNTTTGAYKGCQMFTTVLPAYATALSSALGAHLISTSHLISGSVNTSAVNQSGGAFTGASSGWEWTATNIMLLSEVQAYGSMVWSQAYDIGDANEQLPYFALRPDKLVAHLGYNSSSRCSWWLSGVASSTHFCLVCYGGYATYDGASASSGVRPLVLFG